MTARPVVWCRALATDLAGKGDAAILTVEAARTIARGIVGARADWGAPVRHGGNGRCSEMRDPEVDKFAAEAIEVLHQILVLRTTPRELMYSESQG